MFAALIDTPLTGMDKDEQDPVNILLAGRHVLHGLSGRGYTILNAKLQTNFLLLSSYNDVFMTRFPFSGIGAGRVVN